MTRGTDIWRQLTAIGVAWLFALQLMLSTLAVAVSLSNFQADQTTGFTLCQHDGAGAGQPAAPSPSLPCTQCPFCIAAGGLAAVVAVVALLIAVAYASRLHWAPASTIFIGPPILDGARSRGPPLQA